MSATKGRPLKGFKILAILVVLSGLTGAHFLVAHGTHGLHEIHIVLGGMYLIPIIAAALWFGLRGGLPSQHSQKLVSTRTFESRTSENDGCRTGVALNPRSLWPIV